MQINKSDRNDVLASRVSCNVAGTRRCASKISTVTRSRLWTAPGLSEAPDL